MRVDKGFEFIYWKLSYRRKFIRTLWMTPLGVLLIILLSLSNRTILFKITGIVIIFSTYLIQLVYNYKQYKKKENKTTLI